MGWLLANHTKRHHQRTTRRNIVDYDYDEYDALYEHPSIDKELNIAILEMIISIRGASAFLLGNRTPIRQPNNSPLHLHILTDNEVAFHRMLKNKGTHPIVPFLLRELSLLQQATNTVFTYGTITSKENWFTDAGSRNFQTTDGPRALRLIKTLAPNRTCPTWWRNLQTTLNETPQPTSRSVRESDTNQNSKRSRNSPCG